MLKLPFVERLNVLFFDKGAPGNFRRRFRSMWDTAPSKIDAVLAFNIFIARIILGKNWESEWGMGHTEKPLSSTFEHEIVYD